MHHSDVVGGRVISCDDAGSAAFCTSCDGRLAALYVCVSMCVYVLGLFEAEGCWASAGLNRCFGVYSCSMSTEACQACERCTI